MEVDMMHDCLNELLEEYCESLQGVRQLKYKAQKHHEKLDASLLGGMESDLEWTMGCMVTGYPPMYSEGDYRKVVPVDPQKVLVYFSQSMYKPWPDDNESVMSKKLKKVMSEILTEKEIDAVKMVLGEGISYGKAGKFLGMKRKTVESVVRRAVSKIKR
jgi:predicted DNA-binding protein (UPF0251 family)